MLSIIWKIEFVKCERDYLYVVICVSFSIAFSFSDGFYLDGYEDPLENKKGYSLTTAIIGWDELNNLNQIYLLLHIKKAIEKKQSLNNLASVNQSMISYNHRPTYLLRA